MHRQAMFLVLAVCCGGTLGFGQQTVHFSGSVKNGETFTKQIGAGLVFRLVPDEAGYRISVRPDSEMMADDFTHSAA